MRINKEEMAKLAEKNDEELWREIQAIAKKYGYALPSGVPPKESMAKIRSTLLGAEKLSLGDAAKILSAYKRK